MWITRQAVNLLSLVLVLNKANSGSREEEILLIEKFKQSNYSIKCSRGAKYHEISNTCRFPTSSVLKTRSSWVEERPFYQ